VLFAEELSCDTGRPISAFSKNARMDDELDSSTIVSDDMLRDIRERFKQEASKKPAAKPTNPGKSKAKAKENSGRDDAVERALRAIGSELIVLDEKQRGQVLSRICGAYNFSPKGGKVESSSKKKAEKKPAQAKPKSDFNSVFSKTLPGLLLEQTSEIQRKAAKDAENTVSKTLYAFHRFLLSKKYEARSTKLEDLTPFTSSDDPMDLMKTVVALAEEEQILQLPELQTKDWLDSIFESGLCLIRGTEPSVLLVSKRQSPSSKAGEEVALTVQRTDEQKEEATSRLLAAKQRKRAKKVAQPKPPSKGRREGHGKNAKRDLAETSAGEAPAVVPDPKKPRNEAGHSTMDQS
jgi:hypothetical protein